MASAVELDLPVGREQGFEAEQTVWDLGTATLTRATMPVGVQRTWRHIRRDPLDHGCVVLCGDLPVGSLGARRGKLHVRTLSQPFEGHGADQDVISLYLPRDLFAGRTALLERPQDAIPRFGMAALLADYVLSLEHRIAEIPASEFGRVVEASVAIIVACLAPSSADPESSREVISTALVDRARKIVRQNLGSPAFGPDALARELGVSRSRLYRLFEPYGGVTHHIQRLRLRTAHAALADAADDRPIVRIAEACGFTDPSVFSRAFRQEFGYSPTDARVAGLLGTPSPPPPASARAQGDLSAALRRLHA